MSSDPVFYGMAALPEEDIRSDTIQEISSESAERSDEDIAILEAENDAARLAAEAAAVRLRLLRARAGSSRTSARSLASAVSRTSHVIQRSLMRCSRILDLFLKLRPTSSRCRSLLELKFLLVLLPLRCFLVRFPQHSVLARSSSPSRAPTSPRLEVARRSRRS